MIGVAGCTWSMPEDRHAADVVDVGVAAALDPAAVGTGTEAAHPVPRTIRVDGAVTARQACPTLRSTVLPETQSTAALWKI